MRGALNFWPAFADMMLALFICGVTAAAVYRNEAADAEEEKQKAVVENQRLWLIIEELRRNAVTCDGGTQVFIDALASCIGGEAERDACAVSIGEGLLKFEDGEARPRSQFLASAAHLANCLYVSEKALWDAGPVAFQSVEGIYIDGHTDCRGADRDNVLLGAQRAKYLYDRYSDVVEAHTELDDTTRNKLLDRMNVRSFGPHRPQDGSTCFLVGSDANDRRVTISVMPRIANLTPAPASDLATDP